MSNRILELIKKASSGELADQLEVQPRHQSVWSLARSVMLRRSMGRATGHSENPAQKPLIPHPIPKEEEIREANARANGQSEPISKARSPEMGLPTWMLPTPAERLNEAMKVLSGGPVPRISESELDRPHVVKGQEAGVRRTHERMKKHSYGGDERGNAGVAQIEMQSFYSPHVRRTSRSLVQAITDYVDERLAMHIADAVRQGVLPGR